MPSYPLTFPASVYIGDVKVRRRWASARFDNPLQMSSQVQLRNAKRYEIDITLQPMSRRLAASSGMAQFLDDLQGGYGTFEFNMTPWCLGLTVAPGLLNFQLATNEHGWSAAVAEIGFAFTAIQRI